MTSPRRACAALLLVLLAPARGASAQHVAAPPPRFAEQVEVRRTAFGVPHILAQNLGAGAYAMAWVQLEDYGPQVALGLLRARGTMGRLFGRDSMEGDFLARRRYAEAVEKFHTLDADIRSIYEGFAAGVNRYIELHPGEFPTAMNPDFTPYDVAAREASGPGANVARQFLARIDPSSRRQGRGGGPPGAREDDPVSSLDGQYDADGSNAWAFAPSRTKSGKAVLLRNPHLAWTAGYYEAQFTVPGVVDFYGDFRIGGPLVGIGGFNADLGWSTTNNDPELNAIYALEAATDAPDHYVLDGASLPLRRELVTVEYRNGEGVSTETREFWSTPMGPVLYRGGGRVYILRGAGAGDLRESQQYLRMMQAHSLAEWKDAMRMRARVTSNFTYADRAGNIFYLWNASLPSYPHTPLGDTAAVPVKTTSDMWTRYVTFDSLPQVLNPPGGYLHNENDAPQYANMHKVLDLSAYPSYFPKPKLGLRSQHSLELIDTRNKMSLEEIVQLKHDYRMLLADRVKGDLVAAVRGGAPEGDVAAAIDLVEKWDNSTAPDRRGAALFEIWWRRYADSSAIREPFAKPWSEADPLRTPSGLSDPVRAREAFAYAVAQTKRQWGGFDVAWGDVHRARVGDVDLPAGGCWGDMGCFRVLWWRMANDGKWAASGGDGWVIAVEFGNEPRAYSILAYGESRRDDSPHHTDQLAMFTKGEFKRVLFAAKDVEAGVERRYHPGMEPR
ncbi:MAG: penicillin acylase family protein [Gemmatimonadales bacterium]